MLAAHSMNVPGQQEAVQDAGRVVSVPSMLFNMSDVERIPAPPSDAVPAMLPPAALTTTGSADPIAVEGGVRSMRMGPRVSLAVLPARSVHVPVRLVPPVSPVTVLVTVPATAPDIASEHDHVNVTAELFQPSGVGAGDAPR